MKIAPLRRLPRQAPVALIFSAVSGIVLTVALIGSGQTLADAFGLSPSTAVNRVQLWRFVFYAFYPPNVLRYIVGTVCLLWFASRVEPVLGIARTVLLYVGAAVASGIAYLWVAPDRETPLVGGFAVLGAAGTVFLVWTITNYRHHEVRYARFWLIALLWVVVVFSSGRLFAVLNGAAWSVGLLVGWQCLKRPSQAMSDQN
jgi:membrane associated rhomboid family serine protease